MIASEIYNQKQSHQMPYILGVVTTGSNWRFLKLENKAIYIDFEEYLISQVDKILGILISVMQSI